MPGYNVHIGISDQDEEGHWRWRDGSKLGFTKWAGGQPDDFGGVEDCAIIYNADDNARYAKLWMDVKCQSNAAYICSYYPNGNAVTTTINPNSGKLICHIF